MIVASAVLTVVAAVLFIVGLFSSGDGMIWASIVASLAALGSLVAGIITGRKAAPTFGGVAAGETPAEPGMRMIDESPVTTTRGALTEPAEPVLAAEPADEVEEIEAATAARVKEDGEPATRRARSARKPAAKPAARKAAGRSTASAKQAARKPAAKKTAASKSAAKPAARKAAAKPSARKPATRKPAARKPATRKPRANG